MKRSSAKTARGKRARRQLRYRPKIQSLETRRVLVAPTDLAEINGTIFDDANQSGGLDATDPRLAGVQVRLESSTGQIVSGPITSDANGQYTFERLTAGNYVVRQLSQTLPGGRRLAERVSAPLTIDATDVQGTLITSIDTFDTPGQLVVDTTNDGVPATSSENTSDAIGGQRDLIVNKTTVDGTIQMMVTTARGEDRVTFDSITGGDGERRIVWDGIDNAPLTVNDQGFNEDLTAGGEILGFNVDMGTDSSNSNVFLRVYSDDGTPGTANRFSEAVVPIPVFDSDALATRLEFVPFSSFNAVGGIGADFTNVTAVEFEIQGANTTNGTAKLIGAFGQTPFQADFDNFEQAELAISKTASNASPNVGDLVTYTVSLVNNGPATATSVQVTDPLPAGVTFISSSVGAAYSSATGVWDVGTVATGVANQVDMTITGRVDTTGIKTNTASITRLDQTDPITSNNTASAVVTPQEIDLTLLKTIDNPSPNVGDRVTFVVTASNTGSAAATGVQVRDQLPTGLRINAPSDIITSQGNYQSATGIWDVGAIGINQSATLTITAIVDTAGSRSNTAEVIAADQTDFDSVPNDGTGDDFASVDLATTSADLSLQKIVSNAAPNVGDQVNFTVTVSNAGPDLATGVTVLDQLPSGLTFLSSNVGGAFNPATGVWDVGQIAAGGSVALTLTARVDEVGTIVNSAQVRTANQEDPNSNPGNNAEIENDQDSVSITPQAANLSLSKSVTNLSPEVGDTITFQITVNNSGPNDATGVQVRDRLPAGTQFVSATYGAGTNRPGNPVYNQTTGVWDVGAVSVGSPVTLNLSALVTAPGLTTNSAEIIAADQSDPNSTPGNGVEQEDDQDIASIQPRQVDLFLTKSVSNFSPSVGDEIDFVITVNNNGPDVATSVLVSEELPGGLTVLQDTASRGSFNRSTGVWNVGTIGVNDPVSLTLRTRVDSLGSGTNLAQVLSVDQSDLDSTPGNGIAGEDDQASVTFTTESADLSLTKSLVGDQRPNVGEQVSFQIQVTNSGPDDATGIQVTDLLPSGLIFVSDGLSQGIYNETSGVWTVGDLPAPTEKQVLVIGPQIETATSGTLLFTQENSPATYVSQLSAFRSDPISETRQALIALGYVPAQFQLRPVARTDNPSGINVEIRFLGENLHGQDVPDIFVIGNLDTALSTQTDEFSVVNSSNSATVTINALVDSLDDILNVAEITAADQTDPDSTPASGDDGQDDRASLTIDPQSVDLSLTKTASTEKPNPGEEVTFLLSVTNAGPDPATNVRVTDILPQGLTFVRSQPAGAYDATSGIWTVGTVGVSATTSLEIVAAANAEVSLDNIAEITSADQRDVDSTPGNSEPGEDDQASATVTPATADLSVAKTVDDNTPNVGDNVVFTIEVTNDGPDIATGVRVRDQLPTGMTIVSSTSSSGSFDENTGLWQIDTLGVGTSSTLSITASVDSVDDKTNVAQVIGSDQLDPDSTPANDAENEDDQASAALSPELIDLALAQTVSNDNPNIGDVVELQIDLTNEGPSTATGITVSEQLPDGLTFRTARPSVGGYDPNSGVWNVGQIAVGDTPRLVIEAIVGAVESIETTAEVRSADQPDFDSDPNNNEAQEDDQATVTLTTQMADLSLNKSASNQTPGRSEEIEFIVTLSNAGPNAATGVVVNDPIPAGLRFVSATTADGSYDAETGQWTVDRVDVDAPASLRLVMVVTSAEAAVNTAEITFAQQIDPDSTPGNANTNEDDISSVTVTPRVIDVSVTGNIDSESPAEGDTVQVVFTAGNDGPTDASGLAFQTQIPDTLSLISSQPENGSFDSATGQWLLGDLPTGTASRLVLNLRVDQRGVRTVPIEVAEANEFDVDSTPANGVEAEDDLASVVVLAPRLITKRLFMAR